jgi:DNA-binding transcriptional LysR family regulator
MPRPTRYGRQSRRRDAASGPPTVRPCTRQSPEAIEHQLADDCSNDAAEDGQRSCERRHAARSAARRPFAIGVVTALSATESALQPTEAWYYRSKDDPHSEPLEIAVNGHLRANDSEALRDTALSGLGVALPPTWLVGPDVREQHLVAVLTDWKWLIAPGPDRAIWAVYPPKKVVLPKVKAFLGFLAQRFGQPPY